MHGWKSTIPSFAEWWAVYRKTYTPLTSARNRDAQIVAHFLPHFGAKPLDEITKSDIVRYLNMRRAQMTGNPGHKNRRLVSESTVRRERGLLQSIFERAIDEGYDIRNPFRGIKRGKDKPRTRVITLDEETKLLALHARFQRFVRFALGTGCRLDEIRGIDPKQHIDWIRGTVHVIGKFRKERDVPMQPDANAALKEQLEEEGKLWKQNPTRAPSKRSVAEPPFPSSEARSTSDGTSTSIALRPLCNVATRQKTVDHIDDVLSAIRRTAMKWGHVQRRPRTRRRPPSVADRRPDALASGFLGHEFRENGMPKEVEGMGRSRRVNQKASTIDTIEEGLDSAWKDLAA